MRAQFQLVPAAQSLAAMRVVGERGLPGLGGARRNGRGFLFDRTAIAEQRPTVPSDMLTLVPWIQVRGGSQRRVMGRRTGTGPCQLGLLVDGVPRLIDRDLDFDMQAGPLELIEAIEVYPRATDVPANLVVNRTLMTCGLVAVWTRMGLDSPVQPAKPVKGAKPVAGPVTPSAGPPEREPNKSAPS